MVVAVLLVGTAVVADFKNVIVLLVVVDVVVVVDIVVEDEPLNVHYLKAAKLQHIKWKIFTLTEPYGENRKHKIPN